MANPKCPYCGGEMRYYWDNNPMQPEGWFFCSKCHSQAPTAKTENEAYAAVMKRANPADGKSVVKGKWLCEGTKCRIGYNDYEYWNKWHCSCCGYIRTEGWEYTPEGKEPEVKYCENCGVEMEVNDEW